MNEADTNKRSNSNVQNEAAHEKVNTMEFKYYINRGSNKWKEGEYEQAAADYARAFKLDVKNKNNEYMNRFAEIQFADAQFFLGKAYLNGSFGLQKDEALGVQLISWGAVNEQKDAASLLNEIEKKAKNNPNLQYCLGRAYFDFDLLKARKYLKKAIKNGNKDATEFYSEYGVILTIWMLKENRSYVFGVIAFVEFVVLNLLFKGRGGTTLFAINNIAIASFIGAFFVGPLNNFIIVLLNKITDSKPVITTISWWYILCIYYIVGPLYAIVVIIQRIRGVTRNKLFLFLEDPFGFIENSIHGSIITNFQQSEGGVSGWVVIITAIAVLVALLFLWFIIKKIITNVKTTRVFVPVCSVEVPQVVPIALNASVPADLIGTWRQRSFFALTFNVCHYTISTDKIVYYLTKKDNYYTILTPISITEITNTNTDTKTRYGYPSGYAISGTLTKASNKKDIGKSIKLTFFLNKDKTAFVRVSDDGTVDNDSPFKKQK
jgi:hypothetical protein